MSDNIDLFADETSSGEYQEELKGLFRVVFAARCSLSDDFEWFRVLESSYKKKYHIDELKSGCLLKIAKRNNQLWGYILDKIHEATIIIVDLTYHLRIQLRKMGFSSSDYTAFISSKDINNDYKRHILDSFRKVCILESPIPSIEHMANRAYSSMKLYDKEDQLISRERLHDLKGQVFNEFVAKFSVTLGDALDPALQDRIVEDILRAQQLYSSGVEAYYILEHVVKPNITFDTGTKKALKELKSTQERLVSVLERSCWYNGSLRPGVLKQIEDSKKVLGVKVADIAAGFARYIFEQNYPDTMNASKAVRRYFSRVLLNTEWL